METGGYDVRKQRQIADLFHSASLFRQPQQVEISVRDHDVLGLPAHPAAHIDIAVSRARPSRIYMQTNAGFSIFAIPATPACDVEWNRDEVADFDVFHVTSSLDDFAGDLVPQDQSLRRSCAAANHVLIATADVGCYDFENDAVFAFARAQRQLRKVDRLNLDLAGTHISHTAIRCHGHFLLFSE